MRDTFRRASALLLSTSIPAILLPAALSVAFSGSAMAQSVPMIQILDPITIIATKTEEKAIDTLAAVSTIRQDQIDQTMARRTSDLFKGMPGVWFQERADDPGTAIVIRGLQDFGRVAVTIDGARQNFQKSGHNANGLFYIDPEMIGGVDVVRGPVANIYGSGAIGGVASFRTKDVEDVLKPGQRWGSLFNATAANNQGELAGSAFSAVRVNPNIDVIWGGSIRDRSEFRDGHGNLVDNSDSNAFSGLAKATVRPADGHEVKFSALGYHTDFYNGTGLPNKTATVYDSGVTNYVTTLGWKYHRPEDRMFDFDSKVYWTSTQSDTTKAEGSNSSISGRLGATRSFTINTTGFDVNNTSRFDTAAIRHALTYGADYFRDDVKVIDTTGTADLFTPNGERKVGGGFAQLKSDYTSWLQTIAALRYDTYDLTGGATSLSGDRVSPKFTVGVTPLSFITFYATYAEGYRAPAITETFVAGQHPNAGPGSNFVFLQNTALQAEVGKTKEIGVNIKQDNLFRQGDALRIKADVFRNDVDDFIELTSVGFGVAGATGAICTNINFNGACQQYQNITQARIEGVEFEGTYDTGLWFLGLSGSHIRGKNTLTNAPLLKIQPDQITGTIGARWFDRKLLTMFKLQAVDAKTASDIPAAAAPSTGPVLPPTDAYQLVDYYMAYSPNEDLTFSFGVDNLFDQYYAKYLDVTTLGTPTGSATLNSFSPGRTFKVGLKVRFGDWFFRS